MRQCVTKLTCGVFARPSAGYSVYWWGANGNPLASSYITMAFTGTGDTDAAVMADAFNSMNYGAGASYSDNIRAFSDGNVVWLSVDLPTEVNQWASFAFMDNNPYADMPNLAVLRKQQGNVTSNMWGRVHAFNRGYAVGRAQA